MLLYLIAAWLLPLAAAALEPVQVHAFGVSRRRHERRFEASASPVDRHAKLLEFLKNDRNRLQAKIHRNWVVWDQKAPNSVDTHVKEKRSYRDPFDIDILRKRGTLSQSIDLTMDVGDGLVSVSPRLFFTSYV